MGEYPKQANELMPSNSAWFRHTVQQSLAQTMPNKKLLEKKVQALYSLCLKNNRCRAFLFRALQSWLRQQKGRRHTTMLKKRKKAAIKPVMSKKAKKKNSKGPIKKKKKVRKKLKKL